MSGCFVTFEGVEGAGKSTQIKRLCALLELRGRRVCMTREPGGTSIGEAIRAILLNPANHAMAAVTELLLYQAARAQHIAEVIDPALARGDVVLCDRFTDSTIAYQGAGRNLSGDVLDTVLRNQAIVQRTPDLTFLLDIDVRTGLERSRQEQEWDRIERESLAFHERVRDGFLSIANRDPQRVRVIDARRAADEVAAEIQRIAEAELRRIGAERLA